MKNGDLVKGVPASPDLVKDFPIVVGRYHVEPWTFMGREFETELILLPDGQYISCHFIEPAGRRDKETVLP